MHITLPTPPSANRYWRVFRGRAVVSSEAKAYKKTVQVLAQRAGLECLDGAVAVTLDVYRPAKRGDLDNSIKVLLDSLQGAAYADDQQITEIHARRFDDKHNPRVEVTILRVQS